MANDSLQNVIFPAIMELKSEYFVTSISYDLDRNVYAIPGNSIATKLRYVKITQPNGQVTYNLPQLDPARIADFTPAQNGFITAFFVRGNNLHLYPEQSSFSTGSIEIAYYLRPNELVETSRCGQVVSINENTNMVTLTRLPSPTPVVGDDMCALDSQPSYDLRFTSREVSIVSSPNIVLSSVEDLEVNDWVCFEGESCVFQIPVECRGLLVQATIAKALESIADDRWKVSQAVLQEKLDQWRHMATERVEGNPIIFAGRAGIDADDYGYGPNGWNWNN